MFDIVFDPANHSYQIAGRSVPGVTTVCACIPGKAEWLPAWACKEMALDLMAHWEPNVPYSEDEIKWKIADAKIAYRLKKENAAGAGTATHFWIEEFIAGKIRPLPQDPHVLNAVQLFLEWTKANNIRWIHSEVVVGSLVHMYGGKFDAVAEVNGVITLIDFKTSKAIYDEFNYQLSGYALAYEEMGQTPAIQQRMVLWVPKTGKRFEARIVPTPLDEDKRVFLAALELYKSHEVSKRTLKLLKEQAAERTKTGGDSSIQRSAA